MKDSVIRPPNSVDTTSKSLLKRIKKGDEIAWQQLVNLYGPIIAFWIKGNNRNNLSHEDSGDVFQEVFAAIARNIVRFERHEGTGKFRRWLKVITLNKIASHFRKSPVERAVGGDTALLQIRDIADPEISDLELDAAPDLTETDNAAIVQGVIRIIKDEFRESTWQSFWHSAVEEKSTADMADELGLSVEAVRKNKSRVMARLREALESHMS